MFEVLMIRHGESEANKNGICGTDSHLSEKGKEQAKNASKRYKVYIDSADLLFTSTKLRAIETGELLYGDRFAEAVQDKVFDEIYFGDAEGFYDSDLKKEENSYWHGFVKFLEENHGDNVYERAETAISHLCDIINKLSETPEKCPNKRIVIVAHDTIIKAIALCLKRGRGWTEITDLPDMRNLGALGFTFVEAKNPDGTTSFIADPERIFLI